MDFFLYTDGCCFKNPGGAGGWGVVILDRNKTLLEELSGGQPSTTSNRMELEALHQALLWLQKQPWPSTATIFSDSKYTIGVYRGHTANGHANPDLRRQIEEARRPLRDRIHVTWIAGHSGNKWNNRADKLAKHATRKEAYERSDHLIITQPSWNRNQET